MCVWRSITRILLQIVAPLLKGCRRGGSRDGLADRRGIQLRKRSSYARSTRGRFIEALYTVHTISWVIGFNRGELGAIGVRTAGEEEGRWRSTAGINPLLLFNGVLARARKSDVRDGWSHGELNAVTTGLNRRCKAKGIETLKRWTLCW